MSDADLIAAVGAVFLPLVIAVIQRRSWPDWARALVAFAACFLWTALVMWFTGTLGWPAEPRDRLRALLIVCIAAWSSYRGLWKPTIAPTIERWTTPPADRRPAE